MTWTAPEVVIVPTTSEDMALATELAQRSGLVQHGGLRQRSRLKSDEEATHSRNDGSWMLKVHNQQLTLIRPDGLNVAIDFINGKAFRRTQEANFKSQPLARALGLKNEGLKNQGLKNEGLKNSRLQKPGLQKLDTNSHPGKNHPTVIDATAGLGIDGWMMAHLGCSVRLIEVSTVLSLMLEQAVIAQDSFASSDERLCVINANAVDYLNNNDSARADIIYLDPMYPQRRNKSLVKKGMQLLHELIGPDNNGPALLHAALNKSDYRVVVKRPKGAPQLAGSEHWTGQITQVDSPNTRYDIYHIQTSQ